MNKNINPLESHIEELERELKQAIRKLRKDRGETRAKYDQSLPKKYRSYLMSANKRQIKFELTVEQFNVILQHACVFCGTNNSIGVDRIDSSEGYHIGNAQPCCTTCNMMKYTHSEEVFLRKIQSIYNHRIRPFMQD